MMQNQPHTLTLYDHTLLTKFSYCNVGDQIHIQLIYTMFLSMICTVQGVRARRLPESFKSTRYIVYAMYTNIIIQIVFITLFNVQRQDRHLQTYVLIFTLVISHLSILLIMHTQRIINLLNRKENNAMVVRQQISSCMSKQSASLVLGHLQSK